MTDMSSKVDNLEAKFQQLSEQLHRKMNEAQQRREKKLESLTPKLKEENIAHFRARAEEYLAKMEAEVNIGRLDLARIHQDLARSYLDMIDKV